jgi:hypothetical protein
MRITSSQGPSVWLLDIVGLRGVFDVMREVARSSCPSLEIGRVRWGICGWMDRVGLDGLVSVLTKSRPGAVHCVFDVLGFLQEALDGGDFV